MEAEKNCTLREEHRLWRVDVLGRLCIRSEDPPAESDHFSRIVADRKHHAVTKPVIEVSARPLLVAEFDQPALDDFLAIEATFPCKRAEDVPRIRCVSDPPRLRRIAANSARLE